MTGIRSGITRRAFFSLSAAATGLLCLGGLASLFRRYRFLRPPGAAANPSFLSQCIKCQRCQQICPTGVIVSVLVTEDVQSAGTPRFDLRAGDCTLCMKCVEVCPTGALLPLSKEQVRLGIATVDKERCIAWTWKGCTLCEPECATHAIVLDESRRPTVDASLCNGCGRCEHVCIVSIARAYGDLGGKAIVVAPLEPA